MTTVLQYLVIAAVIGLIVFGLAVVVFGRGEQLAPLSPRSSPTELPDRGIAAEDVRKMRFAMSLRGYRMSDVDWALERVAGEIDRLRSVVTDLGGNPDPASEEPAESEFAFATVSATRSAADTAGSPAPGTSSTPAFVPAVTAHRPAAPSTEAAGTGSAEPPTSPSNVPTGSTAPTGPTDLSDGTLT